MAAVPSRRLITSLLKMSATRPIPRCEISDLPLDETIPADSCPRCCNAYIPRYARLAASGWPKTPKTPHSSLKASRLDSSDETSTKRSCEGSRAGTGELSNEGSGEVSSEESCAVSRAALGGRLGEILGMTSCDRTLSICGKPPSDRLFVDLPQLAHVLVDRLRNSHPRLAYHASDHGQVDSVKQASQLLDLVGRGRQHHGRSAFAKKHFCPASSRHPVDLRAQDAVGIEAALRQRDRQPAFRDVVC